jgi:hypothetical protein
MSIRPLLRRAAVVIGFVCWLFAASVPAAAQETKRSPAGDSKTIQDLEAKLSAAFLKKDVVFLESVIADDAIHVGSDGARMTKSKYLALVTKDRVYSAYVNKAMTAQLYGDVAVVNGPEKVSGVFSGWEGSVEFVTTRVWAYRANKWQVVLWQATSSAAPQGSEKESSLLKWLHGG